MCVELSLVVGGGVSDDELGCFLDVSAEEFDAQRALVFQV